MSRTNQRRNIILSSYEQETQTLEIANVVKRFWLEQFELPGILVS